MDIAERFKANPLLTVGSLAPAISGMEIACILNPGVFRYDGRIWLVLRVAERPVQKEGIISFPVYDEQGRIKVMSFEKDNPDTSGWYPVRTG